MLKEFSIVPGTLGKHTINAIAISLLLQLGHGGTGKRGINRFTLTLCFLCQIY